MIALRQLVGPVAVALVGVGLYSSRLDVAAEQPGERQVLYAAAGLTTHAWHDEDGRAWPPFGRAAPEWIDTVPLYAVAFATKLGGPQTSRARQAAVLFGAIDVVLLFVLATMVFRNPWLSWLAAGLLLTTPAHFQYSRTASADGIWLLPFILVAMIALARFVESGQAWPLMVSAGALTAGIYSGPSAGLSILLLAVIALIALWDDPRVTRFRLLLASATAGVVLVPLALWFAIHPLTYYDTFGRWFVHQAHIRSPFDLIRTWINWGTIRDCLAIHWEILNPAQLFMSKTSPALAGVFLLPFAVLIPVGLVETLRWSIQATDRRRVILRVSSLGFLVAPIVVAAFREPLAFHRALIMTVFGVLTGTAGMRSLWEQRSAMWRCAVVLLLAAAAIQFAMYYARSTSGSI